MQTLYPYIIGFIEHKLRAGKVGDDMLSERDVGYCYGIQKVITLLKESIL